MTHKRPLQQSDVAARSLPAALLALILTFCAGPAGAAEDDRGPADQHLRAAELALERHEYKRAAEEYRKAAELSGNAATARQATRVAYTYGFDADALEAALRWTELDESSDEALLYVAQLQLRSGDLHNARRNFRTLLARDDQPPDYRLLALMPVLSEEDADDAYRLISDLAEPYPESAPAQYAVGVMALQANDLDEAGKRAKRAMELDREWIKPRLLFARSLLLAGDEDKAIDYAARIVGDDTDPDPEARLELAIIYMSAGRDDDALSQVNQILLEQPSRTDALRLMAIINFRQENLDAARADFQDLLSSGRYTMDALYYLARIADFRSEYERALALYTQVNSGQHAVTSQRRAGAILARESGVDKALDHLQRFGEQHPEHAIDMILAQAQLLASHGEYERSLEIYDRVASYRPDNERVILGRTEVLLRVGRVDAAIAAYREAVRRWPDSAMALNALGYTLTYHGDDYDEAARLIGKALKLEPDSAAIIDSYGWVLYRQGKHEQALAELQRAWGMMRDPEVAAHIAEVLWKLDRCAEARAMLEEAEALDPDHAMLQGVRELLDAETC